MVFSSLPSCAMPCGEFGSPDTNRILFRRTLHFRVYFFLSYPD
jgi:hypothetical protein